LEGSGFCTCAAGIARVVALSRFESERGASLPVGGFTSTILPHFGHDRIWPIASSERTFSFAEQVVQEIEYGSTSLFTSGAADRNQAVLHDASGKI